MHDELIISFKRWVLHKMSAPTGSLYHKCASGETQTVIRVSPHILDKTERVAISKADKKLQTVITIEPKGIKTNFYSLLKFTPYQDIFEGSVKIIDLPRKTKLQFDSVNSSLLGSVTPFCLADDDGVAEFCCDMMRNIQSRETRRFKEADVQTDLMVKPQLLEDNQLATVFTNSSVQESTSSGGKPLSSSPSPPPPRPQPKPPSPTTPTQQRSQLSGPPRPQPPPPPLQRRTSQAPPPTPRQFPTQKPPPHPPR